MGGNGKGRKKRQRAGHLEESKVKNNQKNETLNVKGDQTWNNTINREGKLKDVDKRKITIRRDTTAWSGNRRKNQKKGSTRARNSASWRSPGQALPMCRSPKTKDEKKKEERCSDLEKPNKRKKCCPRMVNRGYEEITVNRQTRRTGLGKGHSSY